MKLTKHLKRTSTGIATIALIMLGTSCGGDDSNSSTAVSNNSVATSEELPDTITIGYQNVPGGLLIVKQNKLLEAAFGDSVKIDWKLFDSGGSVNEAVVAGGVDFGLVGSSPTSRGLSSGIEYQVPWIFDIIGEAEALIVQGDSGISTLADLKGKTIATPFASTAHYSLLAALEEAGIAEEDVNIIDSEPDSITAAWLQGDIDGAYVWDPNLSKLKADGGIVLVSSKELAAKGKTTYDLAVVTNSFAEKYPNAVQTFVDVQDQAVKILQTDIDAAATANAAELNVTPEEAKVQLAGLVFLDAATQTGADYLGGGLAANLFNAAKFNVAQGKIEKVQEESVYKSGVVTTYAAAVK